jgi:hypothetical protein
MASTPAGDGSAPSGDAVSKVESDVTQTAGVLQTIIKLVEKPITTIYQNRSKTNDIRRSVGHWEKEAYDHNKQCKMPVLNLKKFEEYVGERDGILTPDGKCTATASWAHLLHALGIGPRMGVVGWKPAVDGALTLQTGGVEMEMEGAVLCHIVNLYHRRESTIENLEGLDTVEKWECRMSFSQLDNLNGKQ